MPYEIVLKRGLVIWLTVTFAAAFIGSGAALEAENFYLQLHRPPWAPAAWVFAPVWTCLYLLMGVAAWMVWKTCGFGGARISLSLYLIQLAVNALWGWLFFVWRQGGWALADILLLNLLVIATMVSFWRVRPLAAALLLPYLAWIGFAYALTLSVWEKNPQALG